MTSDFCSVTIIIVKKNVIKRRLSSKHTKLPSYSFIYIRYILLALVLITAVFTGKILFSTNIKLHVLGTSTGPVLLADHGGDDSGGGSSGGSSSGGGSNSGSGSNGGGSSNSGGGDNHGGTESGGSQQSVSNNTQVDCVGPDGKHFTTDFKNCSDLNNAWHHSNFSFTPLSTPQQPTEQENKDNPQSTGTENEVKQEAVHKNSNQSEPNKLDVKTEDGKTRVDLFQNGVKVRIEQEGSAVKVKAEKPDGTEVELDIKDSLDTINKELETEGVEVATTDAHTLAIKKADVEAETELPISVDPTTHELTVTTPAGTKTVTVLPDQAVNNLLEKRLLTQVETEISLQSGLVHKTTLTELNNEAVFAINGISQKNILGLIPVGFAKTAFVSAITGNVVKIKETLLNRILETLSF